MTLAETMKYGNINVHSVKWVKYHIGVTHTRPYSEPCQVLDQCPNLDSYYTQNVLMLTYK